MPSQAACLELPSNSGISQRTGQAFWKFQRPTSVLPSTATATMEPLRRGNFLLLGEAISSRHLKSAGAGKEPLVRTKVGALDGPSRLRPDPLVPPPLDAYPPGLLL